MSINGAKPSSGDNGKATRPASSQDGQGGTAPATDLDGWGRYIYYRLYTKEGPLDSNNPIYSNDPSISRISSRLVRPPQTAASLKKFICKIEGIGTFKNCALYQSLSEKTPSEDSTRLLLRGSSGPGLTDLDPLALVVDASTAEKRSQAASIVDPPRLSEREYEQRFLYYVVYDEDGGAVSKRSFKQNNPFLGRVNTLSIPPPHSASALKYHLIKGEEILGNNVQIFEDEGSDIAMDDSDAVTLLADRFLGFTEDQPIAITYESQELGTNISPVDTEDPNELMARELPEARSALEELQKSNETHVRELALVREEFDKAKETYARELHEARSALKGLKEDSNKAHITEVMKAEASPAQLQALSGTPSFTKKLVAKSDNDRWAPDPTWHTLKVGEIFYTDGISRKETYRNDTFVHKFDCYQAISSSGKLGFVDKEQVTLS